MAFKHTTGWKQTLNNSFFLTTPYIIQYMQMKDSTSLAQNYESDLILLTNMHALIPSFLSNAALTGLFCSRARAYGNGSRSLVRGLAVRSTCSLAWRDNPTHPELWRDADIWGSCHFTCTTEIHFF